MNKLGRKCKCGARALPDNEICFGCMEDKVRAVDPNYMRAEQVAALGPISARTVKGLPDKQAVRVRWGYNGLI